MYSFIPFFNIQVDSSGKRITVAINVIFTYPQASA